MFARILAALLATAATASAQPSETLRTLAAAKAEYEKQTASAKAELAAAVQQKRDAYRKAGDLRGLQAAEAELEELEKNDRLPQVVSLKGYAASIRKANAAMSAAFTTARKSLTQAGRTEEAKGVDDDYQLFRVQKLDGRVFWYSSDAQSFRMEGRNEWAERTGPEGAAVFRFAESARTPQFVEIRDAGRGFTIRLFSDRSEIDAGDRRWKPLYAGRWSKPE